MIRKFHGPICRLGATISWLLMLALLTLAAVSSATRIRPEEADLLDLVTRLEERVGGRIGVAVHQPATGWRWSHRESERFPMASTFKPLVCAAVLEAVARGELRLDQAILYGPEDVVSWSPLTEARTQISLGEACAAALSHSDNTAANLAMQVLGGPQSATDFLRAIGDPSTRLDRWEPQLNEAIPGDLRDTSTPEAMLASLEEITLGDALSAAARVQLLSWMEANTVSDALMRSVLPAGWTIADRSGAGRNGTRNLTAVLHDQRGRAAIVVIFMSGAQVEFAEQNEIVATVGKALITALSAH